VAAAPTVYRMARGAGWGPKRGRIAKCSFTGEPMDAATREFLTETLGVAPCSMYGSTEVGVILVDYPGFEGYTVRPGALGSAARAGAAFEREIQEWVKTRLSLHEYPRAVQVVDALPRTPAGKVDRRALRAREAW